MDIELPPACRDEWRPVGTRTDEGRIAVAAVTAETTVYEHVPTAEAAAAVRDGAAIPARSLFTVGMTFSPSLAAVGIDPADALGTAAPKANAKVRDVLADEGIAIDGRRYDERVRRADGTVGHLSVYGADYPVDAALATDGTTDAAADDGPTIDAEVHVALWPTVEGYAIVGGVVPLEDPFDGGAAGSAGVGDAAGPAGNGGADGNSDRGVARPDLDVAPDRDRTTILEAVRSVDLETGAADDAGD